jgi:hypothetical protein
LEVTRGDVDIATVFIPPAEGQEAPAFEEALAAFDEVGVTPLTPENADKLGERAAARLKAAV